MAEGTATETEETPTITPGPTPNTERRPTGDLPPAALQDTATIPTRTSEGLIPPPTEMPSPHPPLTTEPPVMKMPEAQPPVVKPSGIKGFFARIPFLGRFFR